MGTALQLTTTALTSATERMSAPGDPVIVGVRHHSPACAKLVKDSIKQLRPRYVLIEGPADFNHRLDELFLPHQFPVAIYSYCQFQDQHKTGTGAWTPFAEWSPEWLALQSARDTAATIRFIDLPVWAQQEDNDDPHTVRASEHYHHYEQALRQASNMENSDALWDHLFEDETRQANLAQTLNTYFQHLRHDDPGSSQDQQRETFMARWIAWAMGKQDGTVMVVCGGWHAPVLARRWRDFSQITEPQLPEAATPDRITGSYLTSYSEKRLDVLAGYLSGMPAPVWQRWCWQQGQQQAGEQLLQAVLARLRQHHLPASTADMAAAHLHAMALSRLRGHISPLRSDWLDALAGSLIKEALNTPLPWSYRGTLRAGTDPILIAIIDVLTGDRFGKLAAATPQPPLLNDVTVALEKAGIIAPGELQLNRFDPQGLHRSQILHRLTILQIAGISCQQGNMSAMSGEGDEQWTLRIPLEQHASLIEAARYGATLEEAARNRLEGEMAASAGIRELASRLNQAALAGLATFSQQLLDQLAQQISQESQFEAMGPALEVLYALWRHDNHNGMNGAMILHTTLRAAIDRTLWLAESTGTVDAPRINAHLHSWQALCHILRDVQNMVSGSETTMADLVSLPRAIAVLQRRVSAAEAAPLSRGAALGSLIRLAHETTNTQAALALLADVPIRQSGETLHGLIALARHQLASHPAFIAGFSEQLMQLADDEFIIALPDLRAALAWLPPQERGVLARQVLMHYQMPYLPVHLLQAPLPTVCDPDSRLRHQQQEQHALATLHAWGIL